MTNNDQSNTSHQPPIRLNALHEATILYSSFFHRPLDVHETPSYPPRNQRICLGGHRETIFGISFSPDGKYLATASQDSTIRIWESRSNRLVETLSEGMDVNYECLRVAWMNAGAVENNDDAKGEDAYLLASAGADGILRLWSAFHDEERQKLRWKLVGTKDHYEPLDSNGAASETEDRPQMYSLQFVQSPSSPGVNLLMTCANDFIFLWDIQSSGAEKTKRITSHLSIQFSHLDPSLGTNSNQFGGPRNPDNQLFVFDASYSEVNDLIGAALSDGTCRVVSLSNAGTSKDEKQDHPHGDTFHEEQCVLSLPANYFPGTRGGHLTALSWDGSGTRLVTCIACGKVVLWSIQIMMREDGSQILHPSCVSILEGGQLLLCCFIVFGFHAFQHSASSGFDPGHDVDRPLFGAKFYGGENEVRVLPLYFFVNSFVNLSHKIALIFDCYAGRRSWFSLGESTEKFVYGIPIPTV